ncbi:hypothetical protein FA15DRAFT_663198 [Coprinopsis marcescibilis]|uniref:Uncharacterized protein n=1 Tax=Coprinopsis marcescibilis TaxID=230819 RepID=A0A5C3LBA5_COPMA|nr:hypothetical protein FA15DRAFT_663198 [Coprinopsis marcescibilis]
MQVETNYPRRLAGLPSNPRDARLVAKSSQPARSGSDYSPANSRPGTPHASGSTAAPSRPSLPANSLPKTPRAPKGGLPQAPTISRSSTPQPSRSGLGSANSASRIPSRSGDSQASLSRPSRPPARRAESAGQSLPSNPSRRRDPQSSSSRPNGYSNSNKLTEFPPDNSYSDRNLSSPEPSNNDPPGGNSSSEAGPHGEAEPLWKKVANIANNLAVNVNLSWATSVSNGDGEETPFGAESRLTKAMKAYHLSRAEAHNDLPDWLFTDKERRSEATFVVEGDSNRNQPTSRPSQSQDRPLFPTSAKDAPSRGGMRAPPGSAAARLKALREKERTAFKPS